MRLLVTGGAGFIGSHYVRHVLRTGDDEVRVLDALTYAGNLSSLADVADDPRYSFVHGDVTDRDAVRAAMEGCDAVVHLAAETHVDRSLYDPDAFVRTNCDGTNVLCDVARQVGVERFLHVSTDEVYGSRAHGSFTEDDPLRPTSPYSASKAASDLLALSYHASHGLPVVVTRSSNQYGPYQFPEKVVPLFVTRLLRGQSVPLYGDGRNVRDWLFVGDNCAALDLVLRRGEPGTVYNVAGGNELTNLELTDRLLALTGTDASAVEQVADRPGHDLRYSVDCRRVRDLGWTPSTGLEDGLEQTVTFYRERPDWWEPLVGRVRNR
ncbi:MAG: dTDP-glucose 4,6-dehydratase [Actinomycetes bacterium]